MEAVQHIIYLHLEHIVAACVLGFGVIYLIVIIGISYYKCDFLYIASLVVYGRSESEGVIEALYAILGEVDLSLAVTLVVIISN